MNTITIKICIDNDAFQNRLDEELQSILDAEDIVHRLCEADERATINLLDSNGNTVGHASASQEEIL